MSATTSTEPASLSMQEKIERVHQATVAANWITAAVGADLTTDKARAAIAEMLRNATGKDVLAQIEHRGARAALTTSRTPENLQRFDLADAARVEAERRLFDLNHALKLSQRSGHSAAGGFIVR